MFCYKCGNQLPDNVIFCNKCGAKLFKGAAKEESVLTSESKEQEETSAIVVKAENQLPPETTYLQTEVQKEPSEPTNPNSVTITPIAVPQYETTAAQNAVTAPQFEAATAQAVLEPVRETKAQPQNDQDIFIRFVENHVRANTGFNSTLELLNSKPKAKFAWLSYGISAAIMLLLSFFSMSKGNGIWVIPFLLSLSILPGYLAAIISSFVAKGKLINKYTLKLKGQANSEELKSFLDTRLSYLKPYFYTWGDSRIVGYGLKGTAEAAFINAAADAAQEHNIVSYFGANENIMLQIGIRPDLNNNPEYTVCTFSADSSRIGSHFITSYKCLIQTAPIMQAAMEYYFMQKNGNAGTEQDYYYAQQTEQTAESSTYLYSPQMDYRTIEQSCAVARKRASLKRAFSFTAAFSAVAIIVACCFAYLFNTNNKDMTSVNYPNIVSNDRTDVVSTDSASIPNNTQENTPIANTSSISTPPEKTVAINGKKYDVQSTETLKLDFKELSNMDIENIGELVNLRELKLNFCNIGDISSLANLTNLTLLELQDNSITDISSLVNLTNLTSLRLGGDNISDISPLANLTNLTTLYVAGDEISNLSPLADLTNLTSLYLIGGKIHDLSPLTNLTNLTLLYLDGKGFSDISPLANLTNLTTLSLNLWGISGSGISDYTPLLNLPNLTSLDINGDVDYDDIRWLKSQLPNCDVH